jgi:hypothetical protein
MATGLESHLQYRRRACAVNFSVESDPYRARELKQIPDRESRLATRNTRRRRGRRAIRPRFG